MTTKINDRAKNLRAQDFDPAFVPSYPSVYREDSGRKLRTRLRTMIGSHRTLLTLGMMAGDRIAYRLFDRVKSHKTLNAAISPEDAAIRITRTYNHYLLFGNVEKLQGRICEIGPGDTAGVSLLALRYGATSSDLVERFDRRISDQKQAEIYQALSEIHGLEQLKKGDVWNDHQIGGITWFKDSAEHYLKKCLEQGKTYDTILSNAVLEHVDDPLGLIRTGLMILNENGMMLHQVDLDDHGIYSSLSQHYDELSWLETPDWLYQKFAKNTGRPNRILFHEYKNLLSELKREKKIKDYKLLVRLLAGVGRIPPPGVEFQSLPKELIDPASKSVAARKNKLAKSLRNIPPAEVAVRGFFLKIQK
jgi:hypothetical protein